MSSTPEKAIEIMSDCEKELLKRCCLKIGSDTKEFMT